jgi:hypothetical protein
MTAAAHAAQGVLLGDELDVPLTYASALAQPEAEHWQAAMDEHMKVQEELGSFKEVIVKEGRRVIPTKWVFVVKTEPSGKIERFKARYVLLGFLQKYGVDYKEVFSPTIRGEQIRLMVSVGAKMKGMRLRKGIKVIVLSKGDVTSA